MPATRRTRVHVQNVEDLGSQLTVLMTVVEEVCEDGRIEPTEDQLLHRVMGLTNRLYQRLPAEATVIDDGVGLVKGLLDTMEVTPWLDRRAREAAADEQRLADDGYLEPIAA